MTVTIGPSWQSVYRKPGSSLTGVAEELSPTGAVARVRFDDVQPSYILTAHLHEVRHRRLELAA